MVRVKRAVHARKRKKQYFHAAKGYTGGRRRLWRTVRNAVDRARAYAYRDRRVRKREFRSLWIVRLNAACRQHELSYSLFTHGLRRSGIGLDRRSLAHMAIEEPEAFAQLCANVKLTLAS